ncbi:ATP-dependent RNA helicase RhlE [Crenothrix polyspora]|uniref:ATP-dependent RNA helicase RhlE n=1 Tax=Crenothrix polyspora TaxID=360316 RepID=A0A1R4HDY2_9GAMM|nr:DEAD/DEAH box helicase [Crenothrix polyspora]SJM94458.1 ATP-dependent RNA helicase RhlE [Crenothrix polyspora]
MQPTPTTINFASLGLSSTLLTAIEQRGYNHPTPIQAQTIPIILAGHDLRAKAQTGSGKTAAFGLSLLQKILQHREQPKQVMTGNQIGVLILVPTRELALQIADALTDYASTITPRIKIHSVYGGVNINPQMLALRGGADILVATPGRLLDLAQHNAVKFSYTRTLVLDEADRLLQLGFSAELNQILELLPKKCQNLLFSATFPPDLDQLIATLLVQPVQIDCAVQAKSLIEQRVITVTQERKNALLAHLINEGDLQQVLVFANAKNTCNRLVLKLGKADIYAMALHGDKTQAARNLALKKFKQGECRVLIATDLAARGIDIEQLEAVINFDLPRSPNDYIHRIGRTGRAGQSGLAISLLCEEDEAHFRVIEKRMKMRLEREYLEI